MVSESITSSRLSNIPAAITSSPARSPISSSPRNLRPGRLKRRVLHLQTQVESERRRPSATVIVTVSAVADRKKTNSSIYHLTLCTSKKKSLQSLTVQTSEAIKMRLIASSSEPMGTMMTKKKMAATVRRLKR